MIGRNRASPASCGVCPPIPNQFCPISAVIPEARKLIATPEISWLPFSVIDASPWIADSSPEARMPQKSPTQADPETAANAPAAKAAASILPSSPMSKIPARSE